MLIDDVVLKLFTKRPVSIHTGPFDPEMLQHDLVCMDRKDFDSSATLDLVNRKTGRWLAVSVDPAIAPLIPGKGPLLNALVYKLSNKTIQVFMINRPETRKL